MSFYCFYNNNKIIKNIFNIVFVMLYFGNMIDWLFLTNLIKIFFIEDFK